MSTADMTIHSFRIGNYLTLPKQFISIFHILIPSIFFQISSPCERYIQASAEDNQIYVYDSRYIAAPVFILRHDEPNYGSHKPADVIATVTAQWSHKGSFLVTGGCDSKIRVWDISKGNPLISTFSAHAMPVATLAISNFDDFIVSGADDQRIVLYANHISPYSIGNYDWKSNSL